MNPALRPATPADARDVASVLQSSRNAFLPYAPLAHSEQEVQRWVLESLIPSGGVTVACLGSRVIGVLATSVDAGVGWIDQLYVLPAHVGQGVGARLLDHALRGLPRPVRLHSFQANTRARSFYERNGFQAVRFGDGSSNEERCPDVLYELASRARDDA